MAETKLKTQAMDSTTRLQSKIIFASRDLTAASGDVAYTGVGFTPTAIIAIASTAGATMSIGMSDSSKTEESLARLANNNFYTAATNGDVLIFSEPSSSNYQSCIVKSYDVDGFTLTWTKANSPTGTLGITFLCLR